MAKFRITPHLWFDNQAEKAAQFYASVFPNSKIKRLSHYSKVGYEFHHQPEGTVMSVEFELDGQPFTALNGGPLFKFNESISFQIFCETQDEINRYWNYLSEGGDPKAQQCGWLKDPFGVSWQVVPAKMADWMSGDPEAAGRVMAAFLPMKKLEIAPLQKAFDGR